jgi:hypothetical protein
MYGYQSKDVFPIFSDKESYLPLVILPYFLSFLKQNDPNITEVYPGENLTNIILGARENKSLEESLDIDTKGETNIVRTVNQLKSNHNKITNGKYVVLSYETYSSIMERITKLETSLDEVKRKLKKRKLD